MDFLPVILMGDNSCRLVALTTANYVYHIKQAQQNFTGNTWFTSHVTTVGVGQESRHRHEKVQIYMDKQESDQHKKAHKGKPQKRRERQRTKIGLCFGGSSFSFFSVDYLFRTYLPILKIPKLNNNPITYILLLAYCLIWVYSITCTTLNIQYWLQQ